MNHQPESPRFLLILGSLFLLAYAAYHLGAAWMDSVPESAIAIRYLTPTPTSTLTLTATATPTSVPLYWVTPTLVTGDRVPNPESTATLQAGLLDAVEIDTPTPAFELLTFTPTPPQEDDQTDLTPVSTPTFTLPAPTATSAGAAYPGPLATDDPYPEPDETTQPTDDTGNPYPGPVATPTPQSTATVTTEDEKPPATPAPSPTAQVTLPNLTASPVAPTPTAESIVTTLPYSETLALVNGTVNQVIWSQDESALALATSKGLYLYNVETLKKQRVFDAGASILSARLTNGGLLATGGADGTIRWWNLTTTGYLGSLTEHLLGVVRLDLPDSENFLASASDDASVRIWDIASLPYQGTEAARLLFTFRDPVTRVTDLDVSPNGQMTAAASQAHVHIWNSQNGVLLRTISQPLGWYNALSFNPDSQVLATAYDGGRLELWNTSTWERIKFIPLAEPVQALAFSPDGRFLAIGFESGRIQIWEPLTRLLRVDLAGHPGLSSLAFDAVGDRLATASADGSLRVWDLSFLYSPE